MGEPADGRVQLHDGAGHADVRAHLDDSAGGCDLDVVAGARRNHSGSVRDRHRGFRVPRRLRHPGSPVRWCRALLAASRGDAMRGRVAPSISQSAATRIRPAGRATRWRPRVMALATGPLRGTWNGSATACAPPRSTTTPRSLYRYRSGSPYPSEAATLSAASRPCRWACWAVMVVISP